VADAGGVEMLAERRHEPVSGLVPMCFRVAMYPQPGVDERTRQPRPDDPLMVDGITR
jgi:hypothetical protein